MDNWKSLPNEVLENIFRNLKQKECLQQCSLTCYAWRFPAQRILFEHLGPNSQDNMLKLVEALSEAISNDSHYQSPGNLVKTLNFAILDDFVDIAILDQLFPSLLYIFIDTEISLFKNELYQLLMEGSFPNLRKTPFVSLDRAQLDVLWARKENIEELELYNLRFDHLTNELLGLIPLLRSLDILKLEFSTFDEEVIFVETILSGISPTLTSIDLTFAIGSKLTLDTLQSSGIQSLSAVRSVSISNYTMSYIGEKDYLYIMKKFPNVSYLGFNYNPELKALQLSNYTVPTVKSICKFLKYLFNIRASSSVPAIITNHSTAEVVKTFFDHILDQRSPCATFKNLEIHLKLNFQMVDTQPGQADDYRDRTACIILKTHFYKKRKVCIVEVAYKMVWGSTFQPYLELFQKIGNMDIDCLTINERNWLSESEEKVYFPLDAIFDNLTNLKKLIIYRGDDLIFTEELLTVDEKSKSNLKYLEFIACNLKQDVFSNISTICPNLKVLRLTACRFTSPPWANGLIRHIHIDMPSTRLQELHFSISLCDLSEYYVYERALVKCETSKGETEYFEITFNPYSYDHYDYKIDHCRYSIADYEYGLKDDGCLVYDIYCESITNVYVDTEI